MADATIDELLAAVESIQGLKATLLDHNALIVGLADRLERVERHLAAIEAARPGRAEPGP